MKNRTPGNLVRWASRFDGPRTRRALRLAVGAGVLTLTVGSAIMAKTIQSAPALAAIRTVPAASVAAVAPASPEPAPSLESLLALIETSVTAGEPTSDYSIVPGAEPAAPAYDADTRWFNGRPVRPARQITLTTTAYSPDARSCGKSADGLTSTLHSVDTNGHCLVAADPRVLPMGAMLSIPGYDEARIVPVLDVGGAIKGNHIDLLFPTHEQARQWGVRKLRVTVWEYADGLPAENPRKVR